MECTGLTLTSVSRKQKQSTCYCLPFACIEVHFCEQKQSKRAKNKPIKSEMEKGVIMKPDNYCCPFCYRTFNEVDSSKDVNKTQERFLLLIKRYLIINDTDPVSWINLLSPALESSGSLRNIISPCTDCSGIIKSFCEYYKEIKVLEMKMEWRLQTLVNIVKSSEKVKFRRRLFQEKLEENETGDMDIGVHDFMKQLKMFRMELVKKCSTRFRDSYPKVKLRKCDDCSEANTKTAHRKRPNDNAIVDVPIAKMPKLGEHIKGDLHDFSDGPSQNPEYLETVHVAENCNESETNTINATNSIIATATSATGDKNGVISVSDVILASSRVVDEHDNIDDYGDGLLLHQDSSSSNKKPSSSDSPKLFVEAEPEDVSQHSENPTKITEMSSESPSVEAIPTMETDKDVPDTDMPEGKDNQTQTAYELIRNGDVKSVPEALDTNAKSSEVIILSTEETEISPSYRVSLQERYPYPSSASSTCSQKPSSNDKLQEHNETCVSAGEESQANQSSNSNNDLELEDMGSEQDEDETDVGFILGEEEEDYKAEEEFPKRRRGFQKPPSNPKREDYDFMKTKFECDEEKCDSIFYNYADLDNHSKLHGDFQCSSCEIIMSYAPELAFHELQHRKTNFQNLSCPRENCTFVTKDDQNFVRHFIKCFLKLTPDIHTCPVCREQVPAETDKRKIIHHFRINHDLNLNDEVSEAVFCCNVPGCSAFFRTEHQISHHKSTMHNITVPLNESAKTPEPTTISEITPNRLVSLRQRYPCTTCSQKFSSGDKLQEHMKTCVNVNSEISEGEEESESEANHASDNDFKDIESEQDDDDTNTNVLIEEEEDSKISRDMQKQFKWSIGRRPPNMKIEDYDFMKTIFKCESENCDSTFYNQDDLDNHSKLHVDFKCPSCEAMMSYAPDLALHELQHQRRKLKTKSRNLSCPRENCPYITFTEDEYIKHFITCFLKLSPNIHTCPVCKQQVSADTGKNGQTGKWRIAHHFRSYHNLHDMAPESVARCDAPDCDAYFRTVSQLSLHRIIFHNSREEEGESQNCICDECGGQFKARKYLLIHRKKLHDNGSLFLCEEKGCERRFRDKVAMKIHISLAHSSTTDNTCYFCRETFKSKSLLILHQNQVHGKIELDLKLEKPKRHLKPNLMKQKVFECPVTTCPEKFYNEQKLEAHGKLHGNFKCFFCEESKTYAPDLAIHEASCKKIEATSEKNKSKAKHESFECPHCDFEGRRYVQHHLRAHLNLELVVSSMCCICRWVCGVDYSFRKKLAPHYVTHHDLRDKSVTLTVHRCDEIDCDAYFLKFDQLNAHKLYVHNEKPKYPCPDCDKVCADQQLLQAHRMAKHKDKLKFPCTHPGCRLRFDDEQSVQQHVARRHTKATTKEEICSKCGKTFEGLNALVTHTKIVHDLKPIRRRQTQGFVCSECGKNFSGKEKLQNHILCVHVGPDGWQFSCDTCDKKCMTKQKLEEHQRIHTQEKPFTCEHCGLSYAHRHNFRIHLKNKHGIILETRKGGRKDA